MSLESLKVTNLQKFPYNFVANVIAAFWLLVGSTKAFSWVKPTAGQFVFFAIIAVAVNFLFAWLAAESGSVFNEQGLISYLIWPMLILLAGIIMAKRYHNYALVFVPAILWLSADTLTALLQSAIQLLGLIGWLPDWSYGLMPMVFMVLFLWQSVSLLWIFSRRIRWVWWERILVLFGTISLLSIWQINVRDQPIFKKLPTKPILTEQALYAQSKLLQTALNKVTINNIGQTDWYFMGVAGFAAQDVFYSEIAQTTQLFDVRFNTAGHSIMLINNQHAWLEHPIASKTSVELALNHIGKQMNADEDVLFLVLSSHGQQNSIQLYNPPIELDSLDAPWLKQTLDNAKIKWRVIVVSACYSGSFIEALSSPTTVVITASRADRASFGCSNDADLTYFGRAFFAESLREHNSLQAAFEHAKQRIAQREQTMGFEESEPQMVIGKLMQTALPAFEQALFDTKSPLNDKGNNITPHILDSNNNEDTVLQQIRNKKHDNMNHQYK